MSTGTEDVEFGQWMKKVDDVLETEIGLSHSDLPDINYRIMFECGDSPSQAAREALDEAGF